MALIRTRGYLERYTLQSIGRNISGFDFPASLYEGLMSKSESPAKDPDYDTVLSMRLREVLASGMKGLRIQSLFFVLSRFYS
ncbi:hypothetical protein I7I48_01104 [Histoplasma ohiense]|nr:hypothetical protein I7I48_01104 [Histoplasma ohiense (nom. inval.)]